MRHTGAFLSRCAELKSAFGGDHLATRGSHVVVKRLGIDTLAGLRAEYAKLGEKEFELMLWDLPGVGENTRRRIMNAVKALEPEAA